VVTPGLLEIDTQGRTRRKDSWCKVVLRRC